MIYIAVLCLLILGYIVGSVTIINEGYQALVERLGRYKRTLKPGLNFIVPILDTIVWEATTREQVLDVPPQKAITKDNVSLEADAVIFWKILDLESAYYKVDDIERAIADLALTMLRSSIGQMELEATYASRADINRELLAQLAVSTRKWGVEVTRVEVKDIKPAKTVLDSLEKERAAVSEKRAAILEAEGKKQAAISEAEGTVEALRLIARALETHGNSREVLQYLVAQRYVDGNYRLSESPNSKILFMDPKALNEALEELLRDPARGAGGGPPSPPAGGANGNGSSL